MDDHIPHVPDGRRAAPANQGFTLVETMVALSILLVVMGGVVSGVMQFTLTQSMVWNRSDMHGAVRSTTELLQQEVGQAGRVSLPPGLLMTSAVTTTGPQTVTVNPTADDLFVGEHLVIDAGDSEETVTVTAVGSTTFSATFAKQHNASVPVTVRGGFASGVVPMHLPDLTTLRPNGSRGDRLKLHGDINDDSNMMYVEYFCDPLPNGSGTLTRNIMPFTAASKPTVTPGMVLLTNVIANPADDNGVVTPCFTYEERVVNGQTYVVNVAITLTTQSQNRDRITQEFQTETKALLNVSPRNVFQAWQLASMGANNRVHPMPASVAALLPDPAH